MADLEILVLAFSLYVALPLLVIWIAYRMVRALWRLIRGTPRCENCAFPLRRRDRFCAQCGYPVGGPTRIVVLRWARFAASAGLAETLARDLQKFGDTTPATTDRQKAPTPARPSPRVSASRPTAEPQPQRATVGTGLPAARPTPAAAAPRAQETGTWQALANRLREANVHVGELIAGLLILTSSLALAVSLWHEFAEQQLIRTLLFSLPAVAMLASAAYTARRWQTPVTTGALATVGHLLVPLTLAVAMRGLATSDWPAAQTLLISLAATTAVFFVLLRLTAPIIARDNPLLHVFGLLAPAVAMLLAVLLTRRLPRLNLELVVATAILGANILWLCVALPRYRRLPGESFARAITPALHLGSTFLLLVIADLSVSDPLLGSRPLAYALLALGVAAVIEQELPPAQLRQPWRTLRLAALLSCWLLVAAAVAASWARPPVAAGVAGALAAVGLLYAALVQHFGLAQLGQLLLATAYVALGRYVVSADLLSDTPLVGKLLAQCNDLWRPLLVAVGVAAAVEPVAMLLRWLARRLPEPLAVLVHPRVVHGNELVVMGCSLLLATGAILHAGTASLRDYGISVRLITFLPPYIEPIGAVAAVLTAALALSYVQGRFILGRALSSPAVPMVSFAVWALVKQWGGTWLPSSTPVRWLLLAAWLVSAVADPLMRGLARRLPRPETPTLLVHQWATYLWHRLTSAMGTGGWPNPLAQDKGPASEKRLLPLLLAVLIAILTLADTALPGAARLLEAAPGTLQPLPRTLLLIERPATLVLIALVLVAVESPSTLYRRGLQVPVAISAALAAGPVLWSVAPLRKMIVASPLTLLQWGGYPACWSLLFASLVALVAAIRLRLAAASVPAPPALFRLILHGCAAYGLLLLFAPALVAVAASDLAPVEPIGLTVLAAAYGIALLAWSLTGRRLAFRHWPDYHLTVVPVSTLLLLTVIQTWVPKLDAATLRAATITILGMHALLVTYASRPADDIARRGVRIWDKEAYAGVLLAVIAWGAFTAPIAAGIRWLHVVLSNLFPDSLPPRVARTLSPGFDLGKLHVSAAAYWVPALLATVFWYVFALSDRSRLRWAAAVAAALGAFGARMALVLGATTPSAAAIGHVWATALTALWALVLAGTMGPRTGLRLLFIVAWVEWSGCAGALMAPLAWLSFGAGTVEFWTGVAGVVALVATGLLLLDAARVWLGAAGWLYVHASGSVVLITTYVVRAGTTAYVGLLATTLAAYLLSIGILYRQLLTSRKLLLLRTVSLSAAEAFGWVEVVLVVGQSLLGLVVAYLAAWYLASPQVRSSPLGWSTAVAVAQAAVAQAFGVGFMAVDRLRRPLQVAAIVLASVGVMAAAQLAVTGRWIGNTAEHLAAAVTAIWIVASVLALGLHRFGLRLGEWLVPSRIAALVDAALGVVAVSTLWGVTGFGAAPVASGPVYQWGPLIGLAAGAVGLLALAVLKGADPFGLSERQRTIYVYAAEAVLCGMLYHAYLVWPELFTGRIRPYLPLVFLGLAIVGGGLGEYLSRRRIPTVPGALEINAALLPVLAMLSHLVVDTRVPPHATTALAAVLYGVSGTLRRNRLLSAAAYVFAVMTYVVFVERHFPGTWYRHPQVIVWPAAIAVLIAVQHYRRQLSPAQRTALRYAALMVSYAASCVDVFVRSLGEAFWSPLLLLVVSLGLVGFGLAASVLSYVVSGVGGVLLALLAMVWHATMVLAWTWLWYLSGLLLGIVLLAFFAYVEAHREQVVEWLRRVRHWDR